MPVFRHRRVVELIRGAKAFLNLEVGITRGTVPGVAWTTGAPNTNGRAASGVPPENLVWIFGTGRTGSTWLAAMMEELEGHSVWFEPRLGFLFDPQRFKRFDGMHFVLSPWYKEVWQSSIRNFIFDGANARFPESAGGGYLVIKEPGGSEGVQILMGALPESRMVLLVRDPRDVVASWLDATTEGGWQARRREKQGRTAQPDKNPNAFVKRHATAYLRNVGKAKEAYDAHKGRKVLVRYEELRADTLGTMGHLYSTLGIAVDEGELSRAVEKHSWENIPEKEKGEGKFYRKAQPGGWREDLTPKQASIVEQITAPLLEEFYPNNTP